MKRAITLSLVVLLAFLLIGCGKSGPQTYYAIENQLIFNGTRLTGPEQPYLADKVQLVIDESQIELHYWGNIYTGYFLSEDRAIVIWDTNPDVFRDGPLSFSTLYGPTKSGIYILSLWHTYKGGNIVSRIDFSKK